MGEVRSCAACHDRGVVAEAAPPHRMVRCVLCNPWPEGAVDLAGTNPAEALAAYRERQRLEPEINALRYGLRMMTTAGDGGALSVCYRAAGGGYEGLQAMAEETLRQADRLREGTAQEAA